MAVQSTDPDDNFESVIDLRELFDYMSEAVKPFTRTVVEGRAI